MRNVIVTGIPRSGTTLASALIDSLPDTVCLNEPGWQTARVANTPAEFAQWLTGDFAQIRKKLLAGEPVQDRRAAGGKAVTNYYATNETTRQMENTFDLVPFTRPGLSADFTLAIKHNGPYLAVLGPLIDTAAFTIVAIVRSPVEVLASWRRLSLPISRGAMPNATPYWPRMAQIVAEDCDLLVKQVKMYDLMCRRIYNLREHIHVLPYEMLIKKPALLCEYIGSSGELAQLVDKPARQILGEEKQRILDALKTHGEYYRHFYPELESA